jgi:hypothetical protein
MYGLDPNYYISLPSYSNDAMLKHNYDKDKSFHIELITDMEMFLFVENNIRGGLSQVSKRNATANNKYMKNYDQSKNIIYKNKKTGEILDKRKINIAHIEEMTNKGLIEFEDIGDSYILYLDMNNLYGGAMLSYLPIGGFKWNNDVYNYNYNEELKENTLDENGINKILNLGNEADDGFTFDINCIYPNSLHDNDNGYGVMPENVVIQKEWLSKSQQDGYKQSNISKLITSFFKKTHYGVNYRYLKWLISHGIIITKIHRVLQYKQSNYLASYIMKNTTERAKAKTEFQKGLLKLMNNAIFGKTMENLRKRIVLKFISSTHELLRTRGHITKFKIFDETLIALHKPKKVVLMNKPISTGQNILDESKLMMYKFHYDNFLPNFKRENIDIVLTDTDSLIYHIRKEDPYEVIRNNKHLFDLSNYDKTNDLYDDTYKKMVGKMKNESPNHQIIEIVAVRPKCYSYLTENNKNSMRCKGVKQCITKTKEEEARDVYRFLNHKNYVDTVLNKNEKKIKQNTFQSRDHNVRTIETTKMALNWRDDKIYIDDVDNITCTTLGHYKILNTN